MIPIPTISEAQNIRWDAPYRLLASLLGMASAWTLASGMSRPSEAVEHAARWAGVDLSTYVDGVAAWMTAPAHAEVLAPAATALLLFGLLVIGFAPYRGIQPMSWRAPSTVWVGIAIYLEVLGDGFRGDWLWLGVAILMWAFFKMRVDEGVTVVVAGLELALALFFAILLPLFASLIGNTAVQVRSNSAPDAPRAEPLEGVAVAALPTQQSAPDLSVVAPSVEAGSADTQTTTARRAA